jgi:predicted nucleic-acid-binding protein
MRAVDTNILVRYVVNDDPKQVAVVERLFGQCQAQPGIGLYPCFGFVRTDMGIGPPLCTELQLIETLEKLLAVDLFRFDQESAVRQALEPYRRGKATFPDYVIGEISCPAGCRDIVSFDRDLRGPPGFSIL